MNGYKRLGQCGLTWPSTMPGSTDTLSTSDSRTNLMFWHSCGQATRAQPPSSSTPETGYPDGKK